MRLIRPLKTLSCKRARKSSSTHPPDNEPQWAPSCRAINQEPGARGEEPKVLTTVQNQKSWPSSNQCRACSTTLISSGCMMFCRFPVLVECNRLVNLSVSGRVAIVTGGLAHHLLEQPGKVISIVITQLAADVGKALAGSVQKLAGPLYLQVQEVLDWRGAGLFPVTGGKMCRRQARQFRQLLQS